MGTKLAPVGADLQSNQKAVGYIIAVRHSCTSDTYCLVDRYYSSALGETIIFSPRRRHSTFQNYESKLALPCDLKSSYNHIVFFFLHKVIIFGMTSFLIEDHTHIKREENSHKSLAYKISVLSQYSLPL